MSDLFNNPMVNNALKAMTPEQLEYYKKFGESLYGNVNFEDSTLVNNMPPPLAESVAYIEQGITAGLLAEDLTENEVAILIEAYGEKWYLKYGFTADQVPEIGLSAVVKKDIEAAVTKKLAEIDDEDEQKKLKQAARNERRKDKTNHKK